MYGNEVYILSNPSFSIHPSLDHHCFVPLWCQPSPTPIAESSHAALKPRICLRHPASGWLVNFARTAGKGQGRSGQKGPSLDMLICHLAAKEVLELCERAASPHFIHHNWLFPVFIVQNVKRRIQEIFNRLIHHLPLNEWSEKSYYTIYKN